MVCALVSGQGFVYMYLQSAPPNIIHPHLPGCPFSCCDSNLNIVAMVSVHPVEKSIAGQR